MDVTLQKTRIIFKNYTPGEKVALEDLVGTINKAFWYYDPDNEIICIPTGMIDSVMKKFPYVKVKDESKQYWPYATITPVENNAEPRNQLQKDFIAFLLENAKKQQKVAGILSPGEVIHCLLIN